MYRIPCVSYYEIACIKHTIRKLPSFKSEHIAFSAISHRGFSLPIDYGLSQFQILHPCPKVPKVIAFRQALILSAPAVMHNLHLRSFFRNLWDTRPKGFAGSFLLPCPGSRSGT